MGLDMYMYLRKSEYKSEYTNKDKDITYPKELKQLQDDICKRDFLEIDTRYLVGYWRKFNALHNYIVENYANGEDDCKDIYLYNEHIEKLLDICKKVFNNHELASELLPTCSGFFFGGTEYDEWYFKDLEYTISLLEKILKVIKENDYDVIYQASW